jgi:hypothetical protein
VKSEDSTTHLACDGAALRDLAGIGATGVRNGESEGGISYRRDVRRRLGEHDAQPRGRWALSRDTRAEKENGHEEARDADLAGAHAALHGPVPCLSLALLAFVSSREMKQVVGGPESDLFNRGNHSHHPPGHNPESCKS